MDSEVSPTVIRIASDGLPTRALLTRFGFAIGSNLKMSLLTMGYCVRSGMVQRRSCEVESLKRSVSQISKRKGHAYLTLEMLLLPVMTWLPTLVGDPEERWCCWWVQPLG